MLPQNQFRPNLFRVLTVSAETIVPAVTTAMMGVELHRETATQKKSLHTAERETEHVQQRRVKYQREVKIEGSSRFKFLDEEGSHLAMTCLSRRGARGALVIETMPQNYGENTRCRQLFHCQKLKPGWISTERLPESCARFMSKYLVSDLNQRWLFLSGSFSV